MAIPVAQRLRERIGRAREQANVSQAELGDQLGLDGTAISKIEQGRRAVSSVELAQIAEYCGRPISWFFSDVEGSQPNFRGDGISNVGARKQVAWLAEFADTYCRLEEALSRSATVPNR